MNNLATPGIHAGVWGGGWEEAIKAAPCQSVGCGREQEQLRSQTERRENNSKSLEEMHNSQSTNVSVYSWHTRTGVQLFLRMKET